MMTLIKAAYRRQIFLPNSAGVFVNPYYLARVGLYRAMKEFAPNLSGRLLDVGCGTKPYKELFTVDSYIGLEVDSPISRYRGGVDYFYDGHAFPFADKSFDSVLCNQVLEHVFHPDEFLEEIVRILKPGGKLLLTVPFVWDEHEQPFDYARYSTFGLFSLLEKQGLKVVRHKKLGADASLIFQLANAYLLKITCALPKPIIMLLSVSVMALINISGLIAGRLLPRNPDLFLDHAVLAEKVS